MGGRVAFRPVLVTPTYNNAGTLGGVLESLAALGHPILVVNDGSTDGTERVLEAWDSRAWIIRHPVNRGKAAALVTGFQAAKEAGYTHALTFDTDGQHQAEDVAALLALSETNPSALVIGARDRTIENYPWKNRMGRRISNGAIRLESGARVTDCQSGLRVYPLDAVAGLRVGAERFGYEVEVITRLAWAGRPIVEAPIRCTYERGPRRISHFRPGIDSWRAVRLHARLLWLSVLRRIRP